MKTIRWFFYLLAICSYHSLYSQEELGNGMIFPQFEKGIVVFKTGLRSAASLNYDMMEQQMLFIDPDSTILVVANPLQISVVIIGDRRFLPISERGDFYEEIQAGEGSFFVQRKAVMISEGKAAAYGGYSQTQSSTSYGVWHSGMGSVVKLKVDEKFKLKTETIYYLQSGKNYKRFFSAKTLGKLFKGHGSEIEKFANEQSIDFSKTDNVARIVEYAYSLNPNP